MPISDPRIRLWLSDFPGLDTDFTSSYPDLGFVYPDQDQDFEFTCSYRVSYIQIHVSGSRIVFRIHSSEYLFRTFKFRSSVWDICDRASVVISLTGLGRMIAFLMSI